MSNDKLKLAFVVGYAEGVMGGSADDIDPETAWERHKDRFKSGGEAKSYPEYWHDKKAREFMKRRADYRFMKIKGLVVTI